MGDMKNYTFRFRVYRVDEKGNLKPCGTVTKTIGSRYGEERAEEVAACVVRFQATKEYHCRKKDIIVSTSCLMGEYNLY